jgi:multiple sugar transport system substrate-binding protein
MQLFQGRRFRTADYFVSGGESMRKINIKWAVLLALILPCSVFAGGGGQSSAGSSGSSGGPATITMMDLPKEFEATHWYAKLQKDLNVKLENVTLDPDQLNLAIASGDLADIVTLPPNSMSLVTSIIQSDIALDLTPYLDTKLQSLKLPAYAPINNLMKELMGGPEKKLYFTVYGLSQDSPEGGTRNSRGYQMRWDYYKEIGTPPINNDDDYLAALKAMQAKHPTTRTGKKTYAIGVEKNFGDMGGYRSAVTNTALNVWTFAGTRYATDVYTGKPVNGYTDIARSHYWTDMRFYNKVYLAGLFDPDSYSMSFDEYKAKIADGAYMGLYFWQEELYPKEAALDPQTKAAYISIPSTGSYTFANKIQAFGRFPQFGVFIPKNTKNRDKALEVLNFIYDPDTARTMRSGAKGTYWDYDASGKPYLFDSALELRRTSPAMPGLGDLATLHHSYSGTALHPDGGYYDLFEEKENRKQGLNPALRDFCDFYGVTYPAEAQYKLFKEGKIKDMSNDYGQNIGSYMVMPMDIKRISDATIAIYERAMPRLIQAANDAEFRQIQNQVLADAKAAGEDTVWQWITSEYSRLEKIIYPLFQQAKNAYIHK